MQVEPLINNVVAILTQAGFKIVGAILIWFIGRWLIGFAQTLVSRALNHQHLDKTVVNYIRTSIGAVLNIVLIMAILGFFGVETSSFAALLAALGIAIGAAWSGLLSNFAAGLFLIILRPFKVGDFVTAANVTGTVTAIGIFNTAIDTMDNVNTMVGNSKIFSETIQNFSTNAYRRVELVAQIDHTVDPLAAIAMLKSKLATIPNVMTSPEPAVDILSFNLTGTLLAVRPFCNNEHYWQVYFDTNRVIHEAFSAASYPAPQQHYVVRTGSLG